MWFLQIIVLGVFLFVVFGIVCQLLGYNDELNYEPDDQDMIYPILVASIFGFLFPGIGFFVYMDSKLNIIISSLIVIFSIVFLLFFKKDKVTQEINDEKKLRNKKYHKKIKELTSGGWLVGNIPNDKHGKSIIITDAFGQKTNLYKLYIYSKFDSYESITFKTAKWISLGQTLLENQFQNLLNCPYPELKSELKYQLGESFVVVPKLILGANIYNDSDGLFHNEIYQKVNMGNFETYNNFIIEVRDGKIVKIEKNIWISKAKNII